MKYMHVVVGMIPNEHGEILIAQRTVNRYKSGLWEFPGGKRHAGETFEDCLRRELKEELGIDVHDAELISAYEHSYNGGPRVSLCFYNVKSFHGEATNLVFQQISWEKVTDLGSLDFLEGDRRLIEQMLASDGEAPSDVERGR